MRLELDTARSELNQAREELAELRPTRRLLLQSQKTNREQENAIAILQAELNDRLEEAAKTKTFLTQELQRLKEQLGEKEQARANLQKELEEKENAIATLRTQSQQELQLTLPLITDSLDPAVTSQESEVISHQPSVPSEELPVTSQESEVSNQEREVSRGELIEYIRQRFPKAKINPQNITDAINGKSKRMPEFESTYGFKYVGKKAGQQHRFIILSQG